MADDDLERIKAKLFAVVPDGKRGALVVAVDKKGVVPWVRVGVASRVNDHWSIGASIEARAKDRPTIQLYSAWVW